MNNASQITKNDNDSKKIFTALILVLTLMVCTTSATYAYFALSASNNAITGTAGTAGIIITNTTTGTSSAAPQLIAPTTSTYNTKPMVPQISYTGSTNVLQKAFNGASGMDKCVDANGNVICRAYTFTVKNTATSNVDVRGSIKFTWGSNSIFNHLRWKLMDSATAVTVSSATAGTTVSTTAPTKASTSAVVFDTANVALTASGGYKQYWLIVWIEESGADQGIGATTANRDVGTWYATISFSAYNESGTSIGGVTSTITS